MQNLSELIRRLIEKKVEFVLVGGFAAVSHGSTMVTRDVDICCRLGEENLMRIQDAVADLHPKHRPSGLFLQLTAQQCAYLNNLYLSTDLGVLDCLGQVKGLGDYDAVVAHSVLVELPIGSCRVLTLDALIRAKEAMGRPHDLLTVRQLEEIKKRQKVPPFTS